MDKILCEIKDALETNELFGIPIGGDFNELLSRPEFSEPLKIEKNNYDYGQFVVERYEDVILVIRMRPEKEVSLPDVLSLFGEGEVNTTSQYKFLSYSSENVYILFSFGLETDILQRIDVSSTIFMD
ncbi:hypothetical protein DRW41_16350 [Neobacillus piezotolerans]|uniref:Uncharacterized protein n=1 Tax=Neobacillus piezotolerans TaxID=2259171 RepID=A0A3D8GMN1_9BACI|nr:hypothetical protein [Neobacillus piezotolerans]RDU35713.1 hypothetical protein DRW41_16350 [Neobacillus piezotolerans]